MRTHSEIGASLLTGSESAVIRMAERIARSHHEAWDGTGYPDGLEAEDIPYEARIVAIADVYDALRTKRPYKRAYDHEDALRVISEGEERVHVGKFDPDVREAFLDLAPRMAEIYDEFKESGHRPPVEEWLSHH
jgi:putative two-component system response regulator